MVDVCISAVFWWLCGYGMAYGKSYEGIIGTDKYLFGDGEGMDGYE